MLDTEALQKAAETIWNNERSESFIDTGHYYLPPWDELEWRVKHNFIEEFRPFLQKYLNNCKKV